MIIGLTGPAQAGKDTVADYIVENYGFKKVSFSDILDEELKKRGLEITKMNRSKLGDDLRKKGGMGVLAEILLKRIDSPDVVIPNFRSPEEVVYIRSKTSGFHLILIETDAKKRYERRSNIDPDNFEEFVARDERDFKNKGMESVFIMADHSLHNDGNLEELHEQIDAAMKDLTGGKE